MEVSCDCSKCRHGCTVGSGYCVDDDLPKLASFLGVSVEELKVQYLERRWLGEKKGWKPRLKEYPVGECVFYEDGRCKVHEVKPLQCKLAMPCSEDNDERLKEFLKRLTP